MFDKIFHSDPSKDKLVCNITYNLIITMKKLGLDFKVPFKEILYPMSSDGMMLDKFIKAFIRKDDDE